MPPRDLSEPDEEVVFSVPEDAAGLRLDHWLQDRVPWRSRTDLQRRIASGRILVDGRPARKASRLRGGEQIRIAIDDANAARQDVLALQPEIVFEDRWIVALRKPPGVIMHPVGPNVMNTLLNALHRHYKDQGSEVRPMIVHRIDKETSGLVVFAKDLETRKRLGRAFEEREVAKSYLAVVRGCPEGGGGVIDAPIGPDAESGIKVKVAVREDGRPSKTTWERLATDGVLSLVRARPHTGRQHQIRVHLASLGTPICCDWLYGEPPPLRASALDSGALGAPDVLLDRLALHAHSLRFWHPYEHRTVELEAAPAPDLLGLIGAREGLREGLASEGLRA